MTTSRPPLPPLLIPTPDDFPGIAKLQSAAFAEKLGCEGKEESEKASQKAYTKYAQKYPEKLQHCRILKSDDGTIIAGCQLQAFQNDPGDLNFPAGMRHTLQDDGEVYVEWIACHPEHTGKGLGSHLLKWVDEYARDALKARVLSLSVMRRNEGAVRLYERKGYVVRPDPHISGCITEFLSGLFIFLCLGCRYWRCLYMEKRILGDDH
jgi:ribosomal protein S18 acetylase RimI-like enzyme